MFTFITMKLTNVASWLIITVITVLTLIYAQSIIVPFIIALLIWFIVKKTRDLIDRVGFFKNYIPRWIKTVISSFIVFGIVLFVVQMLTFNIEQLAKSYPRYISNIETIAIKINEIFNIDLYHEITNGIKNIKFGKYLESLAYSLSDILGNMVMIIFYTVFMFVEESLFKHKFHLILRENKDSGRATEILKRIDKSMSGYISLKSLISLLTTTLSYFILLAVGIDSPLFWAFLVFMLNFIPSVGPIMASLLPSLFSLIQFGEFTPFLIILLGIGTISILVGSLVEPRLMGNTLNISPLVAILSLAVWGAIWGITGMLLSVPITVAMIIVFSQFPKTRNIAILLSEKGRV